uniref:HMG box domain-containing protein n=1 Tax=Nomascus leucogenys TaxID=61853 RepID=A0A2I3FV98_NOMLE
MAKGDPQKPKGKMSAYAFFVQTCREEHKKKSPEVAVNFAEFSKKCSERWKIMSGKEKSKFDEMAKAIKVRYDREMKDYGPAKGGRKKDPNAPKRPPSGFFLLCSEFSKKQPYITKVAKLKKYEKDVADYKSKVKFDGAKGPAKVIRKKVEEEDEEDGKNRRRRRKRRRRKRNKETPEGQA